MTQLLRPFELDPFDLLWKNLLDTQSHFSALTQKITHPVDIFETEEGILFEVAAVGLDRDDIEVSIDEDRLHIKHSGKSFNQEAALYRGIKRSSFDLTFKIAPKFELGSLCPFLDKGLLSILIPFAKAHESFPQSFTIKTPQDPDGLLALKQRFDELQTEKELKKIKNK